MKPNRVNYLQQSAVYALVSVMTWQPVLVYADVAANALPVASQDWVQQGQATRIETATQMDINVSDRVSLQWDSFNIGSAATVNFNQPNSGSIALNRVNSGGDAAASQIMGNLNANGVIYLLDRNGVLFGPDAKVNVASLVASSLDLNAALEQSLLDPNSSIADAIKNRQAAFSGGSDSDASILLEGGASIQTTEGGQVFLFAPEVETRAGSSIRTPGGQTILAASQDEVYLAASTDPDLRGMLVEVKTGGSIEHAGEVVAERGNITLAALAINQAGMLKATTSVDANGTIRLLARDGAVAQQSTLPSVSDTALEKQLLAGVLSADGEVKDTMRSIGGDAVMLPLAKNTGESVAEQKVGVTFATGSLTEITPDRSAKTAADANAQSPSFIEVMGKNIDVESGAKIVATGGVVSMVATTKPDSPMETASINNAARLTLHEGSLIDVSGADTAAVAMERNSLAVELRGAELADSPLQRNDPAIRGETAFVDLRYGESIEFADISGYVAKIERTADERLAAGGKVNLYSEGTVDFQQNAQVDISGGAVHYNAGYVQESRLVSNGVSYAISEANPDRKYDALLNPGEYYNQRWNLVQKYKTQDGREQNGQWANAYSDGKSAGTFSVVSRNVQYDGNVAAEVTAGPYQRRTPAAVDGGRINVDVAHFTNASQAILLTSENKFRENLSQNGAQSPAASTTQISVDRFRDSADSVTIKAGGDLTLDQNAALVLDGGGDLLLQGRNLAVNSDITNHAGDVSLRTRSVTPTGTTQLLRVADGVHIDTSGHWLNDAVNTSGRLSPVRIDAGNIALDSEGSILVGEGALLSANGGAWRNAAGSVVGGNGGDVSLALGEFRSAVGVPSLVFDGTATSHSLAQGGELAIEAAGFAVGVPESADANGERLHLDTDWFRQGGFGAFRLEAQRNGIEIGAGTNLNLEGSRYQLSDNRYLTAPDGTAPESLFSVVAPGDLPAYLRPAVDLTLRSVQSGIAGSESADGIRIGSGASITGRPGAQVTLAATGGDIAIDGAIVAQGGVIDVKVSPNPNLNTFDPSLALRLGEHSRLDVSATAVDRVSPAGVTERDLYAAGSIQLDVESGYLLAAEGSVLAADGVSTGISQFDPQARRYRDVPVDLAAGEISLRASEGMLLDGTLSAKRAGAGRAGKLNVAFNTIERLPDGFTASDLVGYTQYPLTIALGDYGQQVNGELLGATNLRQALTDNGLENGVAYLDVGRINQGGFGQVKLATQNNGNEPATGIAFTTDTPLRALDSIQLQTPAIRVNGQDARIEAPYVVLGTALAGNTDTRTGPLLAPEGSFTAQAAFIDLTGGLTFRDAANVTLDSQTDIRLRGAASAPVDREAPTGFLKAAGDLALVAGQVYTSTLADYLIELPGAGATVSVSNRESALAGARPAAPVLSAGGHLSVNADHIVQGGVLKSPFGRIDLNADVDLQLRDGSVTSVSGEDQTVLFGNLDGVGDWLFKLNESEPLIFAALDEKTVSLASPSIDHQAGATVDVSGGGDLLAYYFVKGPTGTTDVLSYGRDGSAGQAFAILPDANLQWTPHDPVEMRNFPYAMGDTIRFDNTAGLNPNQDYVILPAHYALLPGALLVTPLGSTQGPVTGQTDLRGAAVVAGQFTRATGATTGAQWSSFVVEPGSAAFERSELRLVSANAFFADNRPVDAGRIVYDASGSAQARLNIDGDILASAAGGGTGGRLDINANHIVVGTGIDPASTATQLTDTQLESLAVDSILLGGVRSSDASSNHITVGASQVDVQDGVDLDVGEILLAATDTVTVRSGASIDARRPARTRAGDVSVEGTSGALLQVSSGGVLDVNRSNTLDTTRGTLNIEAGASLYASGALLLDSTRATVLDGDINTAGTLAINANRILLGGSAETTDGTALSGSLLNQLNARELRLHGRNSIELLADIDLNLARMLLDTRSFTANATQALTANIRIEDTLTLRNRANDALASVASVAGSTLNVTANAIHLQGAEAQTTGLAIQGFDNVRLVGTREVKGDGRVDLLLQGDASVAANKLTSTAGSDIAIHATGDLQLTTASDAAAEPAVRGESFASRYTFSGDQVTLDTQVLASSGTIEVNASQGIVLGDRAQLDVAGAVFDFDGTRVATDGGNILLTTTQGNITSHAGARLDLSSVDPSAASGSLLLSARNGTLDLQSSPRVTRFDTPTGGSVAVEVNSIDSLSSLLPFLQDFAASQRIYSRTGDLALAAGEQVKAQAVEWIAEDGSIRVEGVIDASGSQGGSIGLYAGHDVVVGTGALLDTHATGANNDGGDMILAARDGLVTLENDSRFNLSGATGGALRIDASRSATDLNVQDEGAVIEGADSLTLYGFQRYQVGAGQQIDQAYVDAAAKADASSFMAAINSQLEQAGHRFSNLVSRLGERFTIAPGIEFQSDQNLVIAGKIDLASDIAPASATAPELGGQSQLETGGWRYGQGEQVVAGAMRFRAAGDIEVREGISDGFIFTDIFGGVGYQQDTPIAYDSWHFELAAGSAGHSAKALSASSRGVGSLGLHDGATVRTGTGNIAISAGGNLTLENSAAIYTGGYSPYVAWEQLPAITSPESGVLDPFTDMNNADFGSTNRGSVRIFYPLDGGDVALNVGGDLAVEGASVPHTDWLFRVADTRTGRFTWGVLFENFVNGIGTLGGGDIDLNVAGSINNLTLAAPTTAMQVARYQQQADVSELLDVRGGGDIHVRAAGDILAGNYLVGRGALDVVSGGRIGRAVGSDEDSIASLVALGEGSVSLQARNAVEVSGIVDQNLVPISLGQTPYQEGAQDSRTQFLTHAGADSANILSLAGNVILNPTGGHHLASFGNMNSALDPYGAMPAQLSLTTLQGDVQFLKNVGIESHPDSRFDIFAQGDIAGGTNVSVVVGGYQDYTAIRMGDPIDFADYETGNLTGPKSLLGLYQIANPSQRGNEVVSNPNIFSQDAAPIRIVSLDGSLLPVEKGNAAFAFELPRQSRISVGGNIEDTKLFLQNNFSSDISSVRAGGDIRATTFRSDKGTVGVVGSEEMPTVGIQGPGTLLVEAGGDIDLGASAGILSWGNRFNTALPGSGADIIALAGLTATPDFAAFAQRYMSASMPVDQAASFIAAALTSMSLDVNQINAILGTRHTAAATAVNQRQHPAHLEVVLSSSDTRSLTAAQALFLQLAPEQQLQVAAALYSSASDQQQRVLAYRTLQNEIARAGYEDATALQGESLAAQGRGFTRGFNAIDTLFDPAQAWNGDIALVSSTITTQDGGDVSLLTPGGGIDVGLADAIPGIQKSAAQLGIITNRTGDVQIFADRNVMVNQSRIFALDGDVSIWSTRGDIDAGRGSKTATGEAKPNVQWTAADHRFVVDYGTVISGSGIRATSADPDGSFVNLSAPQGVIDAGDAGIGAANVILAASVIKGADNIDVGGVSIGVPTSSGVSASVTAAGSSASASTSGAMNDMASEADAANEEARQIAFLTVEIIGLGD